MRKIAKAAQQSATTGITVAYRDGDAFHSMSDAVAAQVRYSVARMHAENGKDGVPPRLGVISSVSGEGTTFISRSLASVLAHDLEQSVCVVDFDWWSARDDVDRSPGLAQVLNQESSLDEALRETDLPGLWHMPSGRAGLEEAALLARGPRLDRVFDELGTRFAYVVLDLPPLRAVSEALDLAGRSEACLMVIRQGVTPVAELRQALADLSGTAVLGAVLNQASSRIPRFLLRRIASN